jgi:hypothetical protein
VITVVKLTYLNPISKNNKSKTRIIDTINAVLFQVINFDCLNRNVNMNPNKVVSSKRKGIGKEVSLDITPQNANKNQERIKAK